MTATIQRPRMSFAAACFLAFLVLDIASIFALILVMVFLDHGFWIALMWFGVGLVVIAAVLLAGWLIYTIANRGNR